MKPIQIDLSLVIDGQSASGLIELLATAVERGMASTSSPAKTPTKMPEVVQVARPKMTPLEASQNANLHGQKMPDDKGLLIDTKQAAKLLGVSARTVWRMENVGLMPKAIKIGNLVRWTYEELRAWTNAGCPPRDNWKWPT